MEVAAQGVAKDIALMLPPPARQPLGQGVKVLDEDEWTEKIESIIRRDFFPDLPKLENKLEWLQAVRSGDPDAVRQAQLNIAHRRAGMKTPTGATPAHLATPGASMLWAPPRAGTPAMTPGATPGMTPGAYSHAAHQASAAQPQESAVPNMSLDRFFRQHNSEDNASFTIIREGEAKRRRAEKPWLFTDKNPKQLEAPPADDDHPADDINPHMLPAPHDDRPNLLISWPHTNKSALYYDSSQQAPLALTMDELAEQVQGPPRQIRHSNTRIKSSEAPEQPAQQRTAQAGPAGVAGSRGYVATPSFTPGAGGESPLMTWGKIDGTPLRLDADDDIHVEPSTAGPQFKAVYVNDLPDYDWAPDALLAEASLPHGDGRVFSLELYKVPDVAKRDQLGRDMAQKARFSLQRKIQARMRTPLRSPKGTPGAFGKIGGQDPMSPAARRLASSIHGRPSKPDSQLRATYSTPSRANQPGTPLTSHGWASPAPSPAPAASRLGSSRLASMPAAHNTTPRGAEQTGTTHLTDDLLQL